MKNNIQKTRKVRENTDMVCTKRGTNHFCKTRVAELRVLFLSSMQQNTSEERMLNPKVPTEQRIDYINVLWRGRPLTRVRVKVRFGPT